MQAKDIMAKEVVTVDPTASLKEAIQKLVDHQANLLAVVDKNQDLMGVITDQDLLVSYDFLGEVKDSIEEVIAKDVAIVEEQTPIEEISKILVKNNLRSVPVVKNRKVVGIVERSQILRHLLSQVKA